MRVALKISKWLATVLIVLVLTVYFGRAFDARGMPPLGPEHRIEFEHEFRASQEGDTDWAAYLNIESELAKELDKKISSDSRAKSPADRYFGDSLTHPDNHPNNWNRSFEMSVPSPRGVAVLLHGLTDSPYSMLATARTLADAGYNVVAARMPGHGFAVGGLLHSNWKDWTAAVRIAARHAMELPGADEALVFVGYSNGGLLAVDYALRCDNDPDLRCPDALVLMSPAIAITRAAAVMNWHAAISWLPYFEKFQWRSILPEIDPFKFTSFPNRAAWEIHKISKRVHAELADPNETKSLPPILTFHSLVDKTVDATAIVTRLYANLPTNGSEIVIYDINRNNTMSYLMRNPPGRPAEHFASLAPLNFGVSILTNENPSSNDVELRSIMAGQLQALVESTTLKWPPEIFSLSHIAIPFRADDTVYGVAAPIPRGERGVLLLTPDYFLRVRYNPFFEFQSRYLTHWLNNL